MEPRGIFLLFIYFNCWIIVLQCCVSAVRRHESAISIHISPLSEASLPPPPIPPFKVVTKLGPQRYTEVSRWLSILHMVGVYICQSYAFNLSHPLLPLDVKRRISLLKLMLRLLESVYKEMLIRDSLGREV